MARKNIFELLKNTYNPSIELTNIIALFSTPFIKKYQIKDDRFYFSKKIEDFVSAHLFHTWKARGTCLDCSDMKQRLGFNGKIDISDTDTVITILEYYENILYLFVSKHPKITILPQIDDTLLMLMDNMRALRDHLNQERVIISEEEKVLLVPKDPAAIAAAETSSDEVAMAILKYNHASLKGNLSEKRNLLVNIAREYEPLLDNPPDGHGTLFSKTNGLLNCLHIRHNNATGKWEKTLPDNLEHWYDEVYQLLLLCKLESDNVERMKDVQTLLDGMKK